MKRPALQLSSATSGMQGENVKSTKPRMPSVKCPSCGGDAFARNMGLTTLTFRELYYHCRNEMGCGHVFAVEMEARRTIRPSRFHSPLTVLPLTTWRGSEKRDAANDDDPPTETINRIAPS